MEFVWVDLEYQPEGADVWVSFEGSGVLQCYLMPSSQFSAFAKGDAVDCFQFDVTPPEHAVQIPRDGPWHVVMRGVGTAEVRVSPPARIDANLRAILQPEKHQDPTPDPGPPRLAELALAGPGDWLAGLQHATDQAVVDQMAKIHAIQSQLDDSVAAAYISGRGSAGFDASNARVNTLRGELITALNELGNIPDYSAIDPKSVSLYPDGHFMFSRTENGIPTEVYGELKNGTGKFFDQATGTYYTFTGGKLVGTRTPDPGRVTPDDALLFTTITALVGAPEAAALIKGSGEAAFHGLKTLLSREGADWASGITGTNVLAEALAAAQHRAGIAPATVAANTTSRVAADATSRAGLGAWETVNEHMSARAAAYQTQITGRPITEGYVIKTPTGEVKFDDFSNGTLIEVKSYFEKSFTVKGEDEWKWFFDPEAKFVKQALSQAAAARGTPQRYVFAEQKVAGMVRELFAGYPELRNIDIIVVPPK